MFEMNDKQKELFDKLTTLQQEISLNSFSGMNDIDSYKNSSGKAVKENTMSATVSEILNNPKVTAFLDSMKKESVKKAIMTRDEAMEILSNNARVKISDIATFSHRAVGEDEEGNAIMETVWKMKDSDEIDPDVMACIKSVTMTKAGPKIELHDQQGAIKQLSTMQGWDSASKLDLSSSDGSMSPKNFNDFYGEDDQSNS